jgi:multicomponent Na+:H+ antiporter subunit E
MLTGSLALSSIGVGFAVSSLIVILTWKALFPGARKIHVEAGPPLRFHPLMAALLFPRFVFDILKASAEVAVLAIKPSISLKPGIVRVSSSIRNKTALVLLANYITLTPGTLTVDAGAADHDLFIHSLDLDTLDAPGLRKDIRAMEKNLRRVLE